jgi:hypothetical protein
VIISQSKFNSFLGHEYSHMLLHAQKYSLKFNFPILQEQPTIIYEFPQAGTYFTHYNSFFKAQIYFVKSNLRELNFGEIRHYEKKFSWKTVNFLLELPKIKPLVIYKVSTVWINSECFRMRLISLSKSNIFCSLIVRNIKL